MWHARLRRRWKRAARLTEWLFGRWWLAEWLGRLIGWPWRRLLECWRSRGLLKRHRRLVYGWRRWECGWLRRRVERRLRWRIEGWLRNGWVVKRLLRLRLPWRCWLVLWFG